MTPERRISQFVADMPDTMSLHEKLRKLRLMLAPVLGPTVDMLLLECCVALEKGTGIYDRNGREIREGHILRSPFWWWGPAFVYLDQGECGPCKGDSVAQYILAQNLENPKQGATYNIWNGKEVDIIGHIDTTPELLPEQPRNGSLRQQRRIHKDDV